MKNLLTKILKAKAKKAKFGLPPYHFHCRTMIVPVYVNKNEDTGERYTGVKDENEAIRHIDKMGVERYTDEDTYKHSPRNKFTNSNFI